MQQKIIQNSQKVRKTHLKSNKQIQKTNIDQIQVFPPIFSENNSKIKSFESQIPEKNQQKSQKKRGRKAKYVNAQKLNDEAQEDKGMKDDLVLNNISSELKSSKGGQFNTILPNNDLQEKTKQNVQLTNIKLNTDANNLSHSKQVFAYIKVILQNGEKQIQNKNKKQRKIQKTETKKKKKDNQIKLSCQQSVKITDFNQQQLVQPSFLCSFSEKYPYYVNKQRIVYPIEDSLFQIYPQLIRQTSNNKKSEQYHLQILPETFSKQLQIWNFLKEHSSFFKVSPLITLNELINNLESSHFRGQIFRNIHNFFFRDILYIKYEEVANEKYFSFIGLWKYAEQNGFIQKLFRTSWASFTLLVSKIQKQQHKDEQVIFKYSQFENKLQNILTSGHFESPKEYNDWLDMICLLISMCFETQTFKLLINQKMQFFRDNNKIKNELLQNKKLLQNKLWEIKEQDKKLNKREKTELKLLKKEIKIKGQNIKSLQQSINQIQSQRQQNQKARQQFLKQIAAIDNQVYQLNCLPQFSNVWLFGQDGQKNLYWAVRDDQRSIYRENVLDGTWSVLKDEQIDHFQQCLNRRGIREAKLYDKITYYKQLGYLVTNSSSQEEAMDEERLSYKQQVNQFSEKNLDFDTFCFNKNSQISTSVVKLMILKSEAMMSKYLFERNSKWTIEQNRQQYIQKMSNQNFEDIPSIASQLRIFNEKICVVEINIKAFENQGEIKTRKIQTKIWGINQKYKHSWYEYSRQCTSLHDLFFLVSVLYLTIEKYVTKTRKPNNTKYFYKMIDFDQMEHCQQQFGDQDQINSYLANFQNDGFFQTEQKNFKKQQKIK